MAGGLAILFALLSGGSTNYPTFIRATCPANWYKVLDGERRGTPGSCFPCFSLCSPAGSKGATSCVTCEAGAANAVIISAKAPSAGKGAAGPGTAAATAAAVRETHPLVQACAPPAVCWSPTHRFSRSAW